MSFHRLGFYLLAIVAVFIFLATAPAARASTANSVYTVPTSVEMLPSDADATRVVIRGAFFLLNSATNATYGEPMCGVMYFECPAGSETLCRMQWLDVRKAIGTSFCAGFGQQNVLTAASVRAPGSALGTPDPWDLGMGVATGVYVDGKCAKALAASCVGGADAGVGGHDDAGVAGAGGAGGTTPNSGGSGAGGSMGGASGAGGTAGAPVPTVDAGPSGGPDAAGEKPKGKGGGCAVAAAAPSGDACWLLAGIGLLIAMRRSRSHRS